jgi:hypothetical protein
VASVIRFVKTGVVFPVRSTMLPSTAQAQAVTAGHRLSPVKLLGSLIADRLVTLWVTRDDICSLLLKRLHQKLPDEASFF